MAEYTIRKIEEYDALGKKGFRRELIRRLLEAGEVVIVEKKISPGMIWRYIKPNPKVMRLMEREEKLLGKDFEENVEKELIGDEHPIEDLRKDILEMKNKLGVDWRKRHEVFIRK